MKQASELTNHELQQAIAEHRSEYGNLPTYPSDLNAAAELLKDMPEYTLEWLPIISEWYVSNHTPLYSQHPNPARAVSEAYYDTHIYEAETDG